MVALLVLGRVEAGGVRAVRVPLDDIISVGRGGTLGGVDAVIRIQRVDSLEQPVEVARDAAAREGREGKGGGVAVLEGGQGGVERALVLVLLVVVRRPS